MSHESLIAALMGGLPPRGPRSWGGPDKAAGGAAATSDSGLAQGSQQQQQQQQHPPAPATLQPLLLLQPGAPGQAAGQGAHQCPAPPHARIAPPTLARGSALPAALLLRLHPEGARRRRARLWQGARALRRRLWRRGAPQPQLGSLAAVGSPVAVGSPEAAGRGTAVAGPVRPRGRPPQKGPHGGRRAQATTQGGDASVGGALPRRCPASPQPPRR